MGEHDAASARGDHAGHERGSALLLMPAGVLILLVLAAIAFDLAVGFQAKRALLELADAAANDAVGHGLDEARLRADGSSCLDAARVRRSVAATLAASDVHAELVELRLSSARTGCPDGVVITLRGTRVAPFIAAVPGANPPEPLIASARATLVVR